MLHFGFVRYPCRLANQGISLRSVVSVALVRTIRPWKKRLGNKRWWFLNIIFGNSKLYISWT